MASIALPVAYLPTAAAQVKLLRSHGTTLPASPRCPASQRAQQGTVRSQVACRKPLEPHHNQTPGFTPTSDLELARIAREQGKEVELNDDGQIVDKRELLSAGLNLAQPNTRHLALKKALEAQKQQNGEQDVQVHRAVGTAASRKEINERRLREVQKQLEEDERRTAERKRAEEAERIQRTIQKRNTTDDVQSARERYLARKRAKLEQAQTDGVAMES
ncbi:hypothetical protein NMY22_g2539 [Coprinellus aureogranulatus]|nr:hypothetical protein NMY22_g2539 [Coprinellus aureogranulatus]